MLRPLGCRHRLELQASTEVQEKRLEKKKKFKLKKHLKSGDAVDVQGGIVCHSGSSSR